MFNFFPTTTTQCARQRSTTFPNPDRFAPSTPTCVDMLYRTLTGILRVPAPTSRIGPLATAAMRLAHTQALRHPSLLAHPCPSPCAHSHPHQARSSSQVLRSRASFSTTAQRRMDVDVNELPKEYIQAIQQELLRLMHERPEILSAVKEFMQVATNNGIDFPAGVVPSYMTFLRITTQKDFSESVMKMILAFINVGIDISIEERAVSLMKMQHLVKDLE
ncbi:hypothetical protein LXA43DRAFT_936621 [Ganoderma leucocontextum]|nr:hypothetical protein LXA43DRAFT_936621 [Ganoderma leucocontextum]